MSNEFDASEFVDDDFQAARKNPPGGNPFAGGTSDSPRAPSREEVDSKVGETQQKLAELKRIQQDLERERAALEETRRRQLEFSAGRQEMVQNLTRGVGLLEESEFGARQEAEQRGRFLGVGRPERLARCGCGARAGRLTQRVRFGSVSRPAASNRNDGDRGKHTLHPG